MKDVILQTKGLSKSFGGVIAVNNADFTVRQGELRCLIGPNGAGKSTFFNLIAAQLKPASGSIRFKGTEISTFQPYQVARLGIGIKCQVPMVYDELLTYENLWLAARLRHCPEAAHSAVERTLQLIGLDKRADHLVRGLTHSERQWVEIGMALVADHELILLDEPTAGMTQVEASRTAELLKEIRKSVTLIVVEHDMAFIRQIATRVTVLHRGAVFAEGTMDEIRENTSVQDIYLGKDFKK